MSSIEWTEKTLNPTIGCSIKSTGCHNCYAMKMAYRLEAMGMRGYEGLTKKTEAGRIVWTGKISFVPEVIQGFLIRKTATVWFVNSMSDLFHHNVESKWVDLVMAAAALRPDHTLQILTKRPDRMRQYFATTKRRHWSSAVYNLLPQCWMDSTESTIGQAPTVLPNVWLGTSIENQEVADNRVPELIQIPAAKRFLSCEPLLGQVSILPWIDNLDWVITGAESGNGSRSLDENWVRLLRDQCLSKNVKFFYKQNAKNGRKIPLPELDGVQWQQVPSVIPSS